MRTRRRTDDNFEDGVLRPGCTARVPLAMRDGSGWRGEMHRHFHGDGRFGFDDVNDRRKKRTVHYDPRGRLRGTSESEVEEDDAMHDAAPRRPGFTDEALDRIEETYQEVEQRDSNAWKNLRSPGETDVRRMQQGDAAPELTGDAQLDAELTLAANIDDPVQRAYAEAEARDKHAWKRPL
jgi:hypothetical protein